MAKTDHPLRSGRPEYLSAVRKSKRSYYLEMKFKYQNQKGPQASKIHRIEAKPYRLLQCPGERLRRREAECGFLTGFSHSAAGWRCTQLSQKYSKEKKTATDQQQKIKRSRYIPTPQFWTQKRQAVSGKPAAGTLTGPKASTKHKYHT